MDAICFEGRTTNPELLKIADRIFDTVRLSIQRSAMALKTGSTRLPGGSIEKNAYDFLKNYRTLNRAGESIVEGLSRTPGSRIAGRIPRRGNLPDVNFEVPKSVLEQVKAKGFFNPEGLKLSRGTIAEVSWNTRTERLVIPENNELVEKIINGMEPKRELSGRPRSRATRKPPRENATAKELHLKLTKLKAVSRVGWEITDYGPDVIYCGGDGLDSDLQHVKAPQFFIHEFDKNGQTFNIDPDRTFVKFNLNRPGSWPRSFIANAFIVEKDASGGFIEFLRNLWAAIKEEVVTIAAALVAAATGATIGAVVGTEMMPVVGTIVGAVVGAVIGLVANWVMDSLKDDLFESPDNPLSIILPSQDSLFPGGNTTSPIYTQDFSLDKARYLMSYYWELVF